MGRRKQVQDTIAELRNVGFEVLGLDHCSGAHIKYRCRYGGREFFVLSTSSDRRSPRFMKNFRTTLRRLKKSIDEGG